MESKQTFCHSCGYELVSPDAEGERTLCPECGTPHGGHLQDECVRWARRPVRRALRVARGGTVPPGWWALVPLSRSRRARVELVATLMATTLLFATFFGAGSRVLAVATFSPAALPVAAASAQSSGGVAKWVVYDVERLALAVLVRSDNPQWPGASGRSSEVFHHFEGSPPPTPRSAHRFMTVDFSDSPYFYVRVAWLSCAPALAFLALRFVLIPIAVRFGGTHAMSAPAADLATASCAVACCLLTLAACCLAFLAAALLPIPLAGPVATVAPLAIGGVLLVAPPTLIANQIRGDRSRRVFARPVATAVASFLVYLGALGLTLVAMGIVFRATLWYLS